MSPGVRARTGCAPLYGQCGGERWDGPTCCESGSLCTFLDIGAAEGPGSHGEVALGGHGDVPGAPVPMLGYKQCLPKITGARARACTCLLLLCT
jgi:Fungal cellulose binding domain